MSEDPLSLKRTSLAEIDTLPEFALKLMTGKDLRQRTKEFLAGKGLYKGPIHTWRDKAGGRTKDERETSRGSAGAMGEL